MKNKIKNKMHHLKRGDFIFIKANQEHEVIKTRKGTVWLAVHILWNK